MLRFSCVFLCLLVSDSTVRALTCYTSDFRSLKLGNVKNLSYEPQDCDDYNNSVERLGQELQIPPNATLHCYVVEVSRDVVVRGCVRSGGCRHLIDTVKNVVRHFGRLEADDGPTRLQKLECVECDEDKCNLGEKYNRKVEATALASFTAPRSETSLKCYYCSEPCEISQAREKICGENIAKSHEAICTTEISEGTATPFSAVRKCSVIQKNVKPYCPDGSSCSYCRSDLCNGEGTDRF